MVTKAGRDYLESLKREHAKRGIEVGEKKRATSSPSGPTAAKPSGYGA